MQKLSDYAKEHNLNYKNLWRSVKDGSAPIKTKTNKNGRIFVIEESKASKLDKFIDNEGKFYTPVFSGKETSIASNVRQDAAATSIPINRYFHIKSGIEPFSAYSQRRGSGGDGNLFPLSEAIYLCQKAYYNFSIYRNIVDVLTEFSTSKIYLQGGNEKSRNFFYNFFDSINIEDLQDKFFREIYRSGNSFIYRFQVTPTPEHIKRLNKAYGATASNNTTLPSRYIIINPYDIGVQANIIFGSNVIFFKRLNGYEIHRLRAAETEEEKEFFNSLPEMTQNQIKAGAGTVIIPLDPERLFAVFYKKQDYEPMAVPPGFPVLKDIEWKAEMKHVDMAVARTMQQVVLLVNMGYESKDGSYMFDPKAAEAMQSLFESESVGKVLVADFTTKLTWAIPTIGDFLDPKKYEIVNQDIKEGLNYILTGNDSKFANQFVSVKIFVERLKQVRGMFLRQFLIPEMKKIADTMGFKNCPTPKFEDIDLRDEAEWERIVTQLTSLGILTPTEGLEALDTGRLPTAEESLEHQEEYRKQRDKGFYEPLVGGPYDNLKLAKTKNSGQNNGKNPAANEPAGRPTNINTPLKTKKVGISRGSVEEEAKTKDLFYLSKIKDNMLLGSKLKNNITSFICKAKKIKELNEEQSKLVDEISHIIKANVESDKWNDKNIIEKYVLNPINNNEERNKKLDELCISHSLAPEVAVYLLDSKK